MLAIDSPSMQIKLFNEVVKNGYSVRKVEEMAQMLKNGEDVESGKKKIVAKTKLPEEFTAEEPPLRLPPDQSADDMFA